ncbi:nicotinate mononucleotide-dependent phosphoribosyltransferase CobT [Natranaeroarchaeum sulfidigenes]|uniref:UPF0284 protein AArcS_2273 n=1 Tax=Natranaeroarchaeum sulfidigenes TaxID=2784880 RepID=A0A897MMQ7_9EURY|nr:TIGR00303 family protein [Natranaeroarchaeum sulfidigenes]QSG03470.1 NaMN:DMB phosphoribosyltransferase [Natranaeroarchaeum sulfidigenes]
MRFVLAAGTTRTATIEGISAAGATPELMADTPAIDAEILVYGQPVSSDLVPVSPTGCPTPAVISRAVRERVGFDVTVIDAGLAAETDAPTVSVGAQPGRDIREEHAVPRADAVFHRARKFGRSLPDDELFVAETIPGGTTTAAAVLRALGADLGVSSSLPENPLALKEQVVTTALDASGIERGELVDSPLAAIEAVGDPVQATVAGLTVGALESGSSVTLAGGTQLVATAALVRAFGCGEPLSLATTHFVAADPAVDLDAATAALELDVTVTDPGFEHSEHVAMERYVAGEAKEGVGMGGALALADRAAVGMGAIRGQIASVYDRLDPDSTPESEPPVTGGDR